MIGKANNWIFPSVCLVFEDEGTNRLSSQSTELIRRVFCEVWFLQTERMLVDHDGEGIRRDRRHGRYSLDRVTVMGAESERA